MYERLEKISWFATAADDNKAELAGEILSDLDPTGDTLREFYDALDDGTKGELLARMQEWAPAE